MASAPRFSSPSQTPAPKPAQQERPALTLESTLIQLDVFVSDKQGRPVTDLRRQDFEVLEAGVPQEVTYFSIESLDASYEVPPELRQGRNQDFSALGAAGRTVLVMVDDFHTSPPNMISVKQALTDFVNNEIRDDDQAVLVTTSGSLGFLQQLTEDRAVMRMAVERLSGQATPVSSPLDRPYLTPYQAEQIVRGDPQILQAAIAELLTQEPNLPPDLAASMVTSAARGIVAQTDQRALATVNTLDNAIRSLQRQRGAKLAIFISEGFLLSSNSDQARRRLQQVIDAATRASVVVYTLDPRGLETDTPDPGSEAQDASPQMRIQRQLNQSAERLALKDALHVIAKETGGAAFVNRNDLKAGLREVMAENNFFYSLGYPAPESAKEKTQFRQIEVRVKGRPDVQVRFQRGYLLAQQPEKQKKKKSDDDPKARIQEALHAITPYNQIGLRSRANFVNMPQPGSLIVAALQVDARTLQFDQVNGRRQTALDLVGVFYDTKGDMVHSFYKTLTLNLRPQTYEAVLREGIQYTERVQPGPGLYQMRVAVYEQSTGRLGSVSQWVEVPDLSQKHLVLSDIFFVSIPATDSAEQTGSPKAAPDPLLVTPTSRVVQADSFLDFGFYVYNASHATGENPDLVVQIQVVRNNAPIFTSPLRVIPVDGPAGFQRIFFGSRLSLASLSPGKYILQVIVIDRVSRQNASERIDFTVI